MGIKDNVYKYSELYGTESFTWESQEEDDGMDDKKLSEEKKLPD